MDPILPGEMICNVTDIVDGGALEVTATLHDGVDSVIVLRQGDAVEAYLNVCPHAGRRLDYAPGSFLVKNAVLVCAAHGASFAVGSGLCTAGPCRGESLRRVAVVVADGVVSLA
jgi:nitrite reductase/ring-hydroxylating ferredoxin subunit